VRHFSFKLARFWTGLGSGATATAAAAADAGPILMREAVLLR